VLFGDAAAATVLEASDEPGGVLAVELGSDGSGAHALYVPDGGSASPFTQRTLDERRQFLRMNGSEVFKFAVRTLASSLKRTIYQAGLTPDDIALFTRTRPTRASSKRRRGRCASRREFYVNIDRYGNTSRRLVPSRWSSDRGRALKDGDLVAMSPLRGLTWDSS